MSGIQWHCSTFCRYFLTSALMEVSWVFICASALLWLKCLKKVFKVFKIPASQMRWKKEEEKLSHMTRDVLC